jgi:hypothetical protein
MTPQNKSPPPRWYILDADGKTVPATDLHAWSKWFADGHANRILKLDELANDISVSTVFLGIDHGFGRRGPPILWETVIFGGPHDEYQERYTSRDDALAGHAKALAIARSAIDNPQPEREDAPLVANTLDLALAKLAEKAAAHGIERKAIMRLFIDHAFEVLNKAPGQTPAAARHNAAAVLQEAMRLHSIYDGPEGAA